MQFQGNKLVREILNKVQTKKSTHYYVKKILVSKQFAPQILDQFSTLLSENFLIETVSQKEFEKNSKVQRITHPLDNIILQLDFHQQPYYTVDSLLRQKIPLQYCLNCIDINDPGNMGSIIRTNLALLPSQLDTNQHALFFTPQTVDVLRNDKCIQSSRGYILDYPILVRDSFENICQFYSQQQNNWSHFIAHSHQQKQQQTHKTDKLPHFPMSLWISNEHHGWNDQQWKQLQEQVKPLHYLHIPLNHGVESLNVLSATSILLYQLFGKR